MVLVLHLAVAGRYDIFRNELYFIVCGRHPDFGYVDQPPVVPLLAAATQLGGMSVWLLRVPAAIAAALLVPLTVALARLFGTGTRSVWLAAIAAASAPMLTTLTATLTTSTFEPLAWTATAYLITRAVLYDQRRLLLWAGVVSGIAFEAKYGIVLWLVALTIGAMLTGARAIFAWRETWLGLALALAIAAPNGIWQIAHGVPFLEVIRTENGGNLTGSVLGFTLDQIFVMNVLLAPLWIFGAIAPFVMPRLRDARFIAIAFLVTAAVIWATHGKSYYLAGVYPSLFALGAAAFSFLPRAVVAGWTCVAGMNAVLVLPLALPVLSPAGLARYLDRMPVRPHAVEVAGIGAPLTQVFSDEFGWRDLEANVAHVYAALSPAERGRAAILASNYGEAAAIDVYGSRDHLPPALSEEDQYYLWGPRGYDGSIVIAVNAIPQRWARFCASSELAARFGSQYAMPYERDRPIVLCRGLRIPLSTAWPRFRRYG